MNKNKQNIEIIKKWKNDLKKKFQFKLPNEVNMLEKTKIVKNNIIETLYVAYDLSKLAQNNEIFETSQNQEKLKQEIKRIEKDVVSIAVFGQMCSGKSSFLNSLTGKELLTVKAAKATALITKIRHKDNFDSKNDGDIEVVYKSKEEIVSRINNTLNKLDDYFDGSSFTSYAAGTIDEIIKQKDSILNMIENSNFKDLAREYRMDARADKKELELLLGEIVSVKFKLGKILKQSSLDKDYLTSSINGVFINEVVFYTDIDLLKGIELIDTPGLGSNNQLDTRISEEFIEKVDIIMIITEAVAPMQKQTEADIIHQLQYMQNSLKDPSLFNKVFLIVNKIDNSEENRDGIRELLDESLDELEIEINDSNILYVSSLYELEKRFHDAKKENFNNVGDNDLEVIEKTIYKFSAEEATSKFLDENIIQINKIFEMTDKNFKNSIKQLDTKIDDIENKITKFNTKKKGIKEDATREVEKILNDHYRAWKAEAHLKIFGELIPTKYGNEKWVKKDIEKRKIFKKAEKNKNSSNFYQTLGKNYLKNLEKRLNQDIENTLKYKILSSGSKSELSIKIQAEIQKVQRKYEDDYGVSINLASINIEEIDLDFTNKIEIEISFWKWLTTVFTSNDKIYKDITTEAWLRYLEDTYIPFSIIKINKALSDSETKMKNKVNEKIDEIINTIESQLVQQKRDKVRSNKDKEALKDQKKQIQEAFKSLKIEFIDKTEQQKQELFQEKGKR